MRAAHLAVRCSRAPRLKNDVRPAAVKPKKSFGQNFLVDDSVTVAIARQAQITRGDHVIEIGPGTGNLTAALLRTGSKVTAIEADYTLLEGLEGRFEQELKGGELQLVRGDATRLSLRDYVSQDLQKRSRVVANLPYNITTAVLKLLLPMGDVLDDVFVMLQLEAAQRLTGNFQGSTQYRAMSVFVEFYSEATMGMFVSRNAFNPKPHVDSAMVHFKLKDAAKRLAVPSEQAFTRLVNVSFSSRRKVLRNNLKAVFDPVAVEQAMKEVNISHDARPQEVTVEQFAILANKLS